MRIIRAKLNHFRNYTAADFEPHPGVNVLLGDNGQGKTNLLEALYLCCTGRSHRTRQDRELIRWEADFASVYVQAEKNDGSHEVEVIMPTLGKRKIKIAGREASRSGELMGHVTGVLFSPEDLRTVKDGPAERRRMIDMTLAQLRPAYYYALQRYNRALKQRNEALRACAVNPSLISTLDLWDEQLAAAGSELMRHRRSYIERLSVAAEETYNEIADGREKLRVRYQPSVSAGDDLQSNLNALLAARENDVRRLTTSVGAHRDEVLLTIDGREVRSFGSQGQQRTAALSLRLSELTVMKEEMGEWPVLMLDDVMSELDPHRRRQLIARLEGIQTIVTCTDMDDLAGAQIGAAWRVHGAELERVK